MSLKKRMIGAGITLIALVAVGLVYAAWTSSGNGSGYAKAGTAQALSTVDVSASTTATLYPGSNGDVLIEIDNPNPYPVRVTSITGNGTITADGGHPGCVTTGRLVHRPDWPDDRHRCERQHADRLEWGREHVERL